MRYIKLAFIGIAWLTQPLVHALPQKVEIGVSLPLSGTLSEIGSAVSNGIALAKQQHAEQFQTIDFIFDDHKYDAKSAISSFENLRKRRDVQLLYVWGSPTCLAVAPIAERHQQPLICFSGDPKPTLEYVLSFNNPAADYAMLTTKHLESLKVSRFALLYSEMQFYENLANALEQQTKEIGIAAHRESFLPDAMDFSSLVNRLKSQKYDTLALFLLPAQIAPFSKAMKRLEYAPTIIGADTFADTEAMREAHGVFDDSVYVDMTVPPEFVSKYRAKFQNLSNLAFAYNGYSFALLVAEAFEGPVRARNSKALLQRLQTQNFRKADSPQYRKTAEFGKYFSFPIELKRVASSR